MKSVLIIVLLLTIGLAALVLSPNQWLSGAVGNNANVRRDKLLRIQAGISTQTGKNIFQTQSHNLTVNVNPELVDLDSQIISCDPNVGNLTSNVSAIGGSCVGGTTTLSSTKGMYSNRKTECHIW